MRRDVPIPWSVSLPCVVAVGALLFGWHCLASPRRPQAAEPATAAPAPTPLAPAVPVAQARMEEAQGVTTPGGVASPPPSEPAQVAPPPGPPAPPPEPVDRTSWLALATIGGGDLPDGESGSAARALLRLRDRLGARASSFELRKVERARVVAVVTAETGGGRRDALARELAAFGERFDARILVPARIDAARRPWVALFVGDALDAPDFDGVVASASGPLPLAEIGERQLRGALARGPELRLLPWVVAGAAGAAASEALGDALAANEPLPSLAAIVAWGDRERTAELARGATSFAAFCLARGPRDAAATGLFDLLKLDASLLPSGEEARAGEIAARLGATRLEELESEWRKARR